MTRQYGTTNIAASVNVPAVGTVGDMYFNTTNERVYVSDGTVWLPLQPHEDGWIPTIYQWMPARANTFLVRDFNATASTFSVGTRVSGQQSGSTWYGVVTAVASGAPAILANPLNPVSFNTTSNIFTRSAHGLLNGDVIYFTNSGAGGTTMPGAVFQNLPYYVIASAATTFQISATPGGAAIVITGSNGTTEIATGTFVTCAPNGDYTFTRNVNVLNAKYSYVVAPPGYPGWFNYTTGQLVNPLTFTLGYSVIPTALWYNFRIDGNMVHYNMRDGANGTSNATTLSISLPVQAANPSANALWTGQLAIVDNGATVSTAAGCQIGPGGTVVQCWRDYGNVGGWTASLGKRIIRGQIIYQI